MNIQNLLLQHLYQALLKINAESFFHLIKIHISTHKQFGDYQINGLIPISKLLNISVENFSKKLIKFINLQHMVEIIKFEQPGFINIFLSSTWIENQINYIGNLPNFGIYSKQQKTIIIDYSGPNIAKEMHVGHLRSTVIGDSTARILSFLGHHVIKANHIGDWGTQFGMLIAYIHKQIPHNFSLNKIQSFDVLEKYYQEAKKIYDIDPNFAKLARHYVVKLQQGDGYCKKIWQHLVNISVSNNQKLYNRLNITLKKSDIMGESMYQNMLPHIVRDLKNKKIAVTSNNATVVFLNKDQKNEYYSSFGVIIQKKDGGYLYSTTDIACIKYRCEILHADRIIYYTDSRQKQHLLQAWKIAHKAGYIPKSVSFEHHICGMILQKNRKPFQTRAGNVLKLTTLLNEAFKKAHDLIYRKNPNLEDIKLNKLAHIISIGAIKYTELSKNRSTNYIFNWDTMLNFNGNTALYIQYAYTRIFSILKKTGQPNLKKNKYKIQIITKKEKLLATCLLQFNEIIEIIADQGTPHLLCNYLYKLSALFSSFYESYPILETKNIHLQHSRLKLSLFTAHILKQGLELLGIETSEYM
ncbi:arginyl-tRNA synthetase [Candidatus Blochmanniella vafra str. BVAF]|uniref:Arginine--tRNA ligase n=1 Tax=Blochmanniella vafra (strain BVAF) TaxID=859654 RepID=E8Q719_BLOVB|nr:arginine--tRNA ligase [Candidatus Blochmannia vafer]ADV33843.1 arginyl-tRNA synthetase [Candidatus Blochmannia vafer str. BVAF]